MWFNTTKNIHYGSFYEFNAANTIVVIIAMGMEF